MRWLLTGGCGFIGSNLAARRAGMGDEVTVFDNLSRRGSERNARWLSDRGVVVRTASVLDRQRVDDAVRWGRPDVVVHLAAQTAVTTSLVNPVGDCTANVLGTLHVLEAVRRFAPGAVFIFASTNKVYGSLPRQSEPVSEAQPVAPATPYGCSKAAADLYCLDYARTFGVRSVVFRMSCVYGPRQWGTEDQGWLAHFAFAAARDEPVTVYGTGSQVRDVLFVDDVCDAYERAADRSWRVAGEAFNLGGGVPNILTVGEAAERLGLTVVQAAARQGDQTYYVSDTGKAGRLLGWTPTVGVDDGLNRLQEWTGGAKG